MLQLYPYITNLSATARPRIPSIRIRYLGPSSLITTSISSLPNQAPRYEYS